ncbi:amino acid ABC transporter substrate-binding protein [Amycolatopsis sp. K13G38]|uniref:Amino acid ABC transporter substrate-binding protein n=1 Tax=Amycolatopsis acididurans TaxID=2724524 RepID=A0ABX1J7P1_9PSEU|nr:ABC transporter substrate-binding protein [Amycolatopsis acididurans]NKQ55802.1 amino acid ABC transporter substrate-binding protein [Amycolatopsis acididurans]
MSIKEMTGAAAFAGTSAQKGVELAVDEINQQHYLGGTTLAVDVEDSQYSAQTAASKATQGIADKKYAAISGPLSSQQAAAIAPVAQKSKMPTIFTQASSDGVLVGDYIYRVTAPQTTFYAANIGPYLRDKNVKTVSVLYNSGSPTLVELATKVIPDMARQYGFTIKDTNAVQLSTQDFTTPAAQMAGGKPDAAIVLLIGAQNPAMVTQLRQSGYTGPIVGNQSASGNNMAPAGQAGVGMAWATDFNVADSSPETQNFVSRYRQKFGEDPMNYAAESYDSIWMLARALKQGNSADRQELQKALDAVAGTGFDGAEGKLKFTNRDLRLPGLLVQWDGKKEALLSKAAG